MVDPRYDDDRLTVMGLLAETWKGLGTVLWPQIAQHGLSETEFEVLLRLVRTECHRLRMSDLAAQTGLSTSGVTRVVDRLERNGLVARRACASDRRGLWAELTPAGEERISAVLTGHLDLIDTWVTGRLSDRQLEGLVEGLRVIRDAVRPGAVAGTPVVAHDVPVAAAG
jgi:DNA-binding MarR family transcriptional regulator